MNQNPPKYSAKFPHLSVLNPTLAIALASLEIQLDQELTRYKSNCNFTIPEIPLVVENCTIPDEKAIYNDIQISTEILTPDPYQELVNQEIENNLTPTNLEKIDGIVNTRIRYFENQNLPPNNLSKQPNNYLESSQALLQRLIAEASKKTKTFKTSSFRNFVLSPLGIGSLLFLLLTTLTLGYLVLNSKNSLFNFSNLFNSNSSHTTKNTELINHNSQSTTKPKITLIPKYPNLATQEFRQLKDTKDIVDLTPRVKPTPQITSSNSQN